MSITFGDFKAAYTQLDIPASKRMKDADLEKTFTKIASLDGDPTTIDTKDLVALRDKSVKDGDKISSLDLAALGIKDNTEDLIAALSKGNYSALPPNELEFAMTRRDSDVSDSHMLDTKQIQPATADDFWGRGKKKEDKGIDYTLTASDTRIRGDADGHGYLYDSVDKFLNNGNADKLGEGLGLAYYQKLQGGEFKIPYEKDGKLMLKYNDFQAIFKGDTESVLKKYNLSVEDGPSGEKMIVFNKKRADGGSDNKAFCMIFGASVYRTLLDPPDKKAGEKSPWETKLIEDDPAGKRAYGNWNTFVELEKGKDGVWGFVLPGKEKDKDDTGTPVVPDKTWVTSETRFIPRIRNAEGMRTTDAGPFAEADCYRADEFLKGFPWPKGSTLPGDWKVYDFWVKIGKDGEPEVKMKLLLNGKEQEVSASGDDVRDWVLSRSAKEFDHPASISDKETQNTQGFLKPGDKTQFDETSLHFRALSQVFHEQLHSAQDIMVENKVDKGEFPTGTTTCNEVNAYLTKGMEGMIGLLNTTYKQEQSGELPKGTFEALCKRYKGEIDEFIKFMTVDPKDISVFSQWMTSNPKEQAKRQEDIQKLLEYLKISVSR